MRALRRLLVRLGHAAWGRGSDGRLREEMDEHLALQTEELLHRGVPAAEARRQARIKLGAVEPIRDSCRAERGLPWLETLGRDLAHGLRQLRRSPGFAAAAIVTLALGIGANTAVFSLVDALLLRPLPVEHAEQIAVLAFRQGEGPLGAQFSLADLHDLRAQTGRAFSGLLGYMDLLDGLSDQGRAGRMYANYVTGDYFSLLGVRPYLGRLILPSEGRTSGADPILVLSYDYWKSRFGGSSAIVGRTLELNGKPVTVIGVAPPGFHGLRALADVEGYVPLSMATTYEAGWPANLLVNRVIQNFYVYGRLRPGVSVAQAGAAANVVARRLAASYPETDRGMAISVYPERLARPSPDSAGPLARGAVLFLALVVLVLLLACANVANLLLVRATGREREMAMRMAMGAGRARLARQLLTESILLAALGGVAGMALGMVAVHAIGAVRLHTFVPVVFDFGLDWRVFAYGFIAALLTGILAGAAPALRVGREQASAVLQRAGRSIVSAGGRLRSVLVVVQVAGSLTLLVIAALLTESLVHVQRADLGFRPDHVVNLAMDPAEAGYGEAQGLAFYRALLERVRALPGVEAAGLESSTPLSDYSNNDNLKIAHYPNPPGQPLPLVWYSVISPDLFRTLRIPLLRGRSFSAADGKGGLDVAIVNQAFATRYWPGRNPIGEHFAKVSGITNPEYEVVGVVGNTRFRGLTGPFEPYFYLPQEQNYALSSLEVLEVRGAAPPTAVIGAVEAVVRRLAPALPVFNVQTLSDSLDTLSAFLLFRVAAAMAVALGALGLILALVGVYSVIAYSVSQRTREIGIRMALGGQPGEVLWTLSAQGVAVVGAGIAIGMVGALLASRLLSAFLVGVSFTDPLTYAGAGLLLGLAALAAGYVPARRATRTDPTRALRAD